MKDSRYAEEEKKFHRKSKSWAPGSTMSRAGSSSRLRKLQQLLNFVNSFLAEYAYNKPKNIIQNVIELLNSLISAQTLPKCPFPPKFSFIFATFPKQSV